MDYLKIDNQDHLLIVTLDQPGEKVNKLNEELIKEFGTLLEQAEDDSVQGMILISGKKDTFIAGADVKMLQEKKAPEEVEDLSRRGNELLLRVAHFPKPIVAAIHGACVGGGNEVAMACHYRVATDDAATKFSQPEVQLGLLPGGGGTQRLPRLIGLQKALPYLLTGKNMYPRQAYKMGLVDELVHQGVLLKAAKEAAQGLHEGKLKRKDKRGLAEKILEGNAAGRKIIFSQARKQAKKQSKGNYPAPGWIIDCVQEGYENGLEAGLKKESIGFGKLAATPESKAMVNLFFAMQQAKRNPQKDKAREVQKLAVLGAGLMGAGIADVSVNNDYKVVLKDQSTEQAAQGEKTIWKNLDKQVSKHIISSFKRDRTISRITPTGSYKGFGNVDLVIEAVFEDLDLKQSIIKEVEKVVPEHCIYASNTSSLPIYKIAETSERPEQVVGMHYFSPVQKMPLVEVIQTDKTADWVTATARQVGINQGKHVITVNDGPGFYTTRILAPFMNEALMLLEEGISIEQLDRDMKQFGFPVGPAALFDEVGIDVAAHITEVLNPMFKKRGMQPSAKPQELLDAGYKGRKNGTGFYHYMQKGSTKKKADPNTDIYQFFGGNERKKIDTEQVQNRMALMMVNEAALCLQEDILLNPTDGDLGAVMGLGFPPFLGGPFRYVDRIGAGEIVDCMENLEEEFSVRFKPADILKDHAKRDALFHTK